MKKILLTGANGFIGKQVLINLLSRKYEVHAIYSNSSNRIEHPMLTWHRADLHDQALVSNLIHQICPTYLLHLAWYAEHQKYWISELNINWLVSSLHLLKTFIQSGGKRTLFAGSCAEYDWQHKCCKELLTPCNPVSLYGISKHTLNQLGNAVSNLYQISFAWARLFFIYGDFEKKERLIPSIILNFLKKEKVIIHHGAQVRDFLYVKDTADALITLLESNVSGAVNIGSGKPVKIDSIAERIAKKLNINYFPHKTSNKLPVDWVTADITRLTEEVKWKQKFTLDAGLENTIHWWSQQI